MHHLIIAISIFRFNACHPMVLLKLSFFIVTFHAEPSFFPGRCNFCAMDHFRRSNEQPETSIYKLTVASILAFEITAEYVEKTMLILGSFIQLIYKQIFGGTIYIDRLKRPRGNMIPVISEYVVVKIPILLKERLGWLGG